MRYLTFVICVILLSSFSFTSDLLYKRLQKKYTKDKSECLRFARKKIKANSTNAIPYYFAAQVCYDRYKSTNSLKSRYLNFSRSLGYGTSFNKKTNAALTNKVNWESLQGNLLNEITILRADLAKNRENDKLKRLNKKFSRFSGKKEFIKNEKAELTSRDLTSRFKNGQYFGVPNGTEIIAPAFPGMEKELLSMINKGRKEKGMGELEWNEDLSHAARYHAFDLATQHYFDHNSYDRINNKEVEVCGTFIRIRKFYNDSFVNTENIAAGSSTAAGTYHQWYTSQGHYYNMFDKTSKKVGIGIYYDEASPYKYYYVFCTAR